MKTNNNDYYSIEKWYLSTNELISTHTDKKVVHNEKEE